MWVAIPAFGLEVEVEPIRLEGKSGHTLKVKAFREKGSTKKFTNPLRAMLGRTFVNLDNALDVACDLCNIALPVLPPRPFDTDTPHVRPRLNKPQAKEEAPQHVRPRLNQNKKIVRKNG